MGVVVMSFVGFFFGGGCGCDGFCGFFFPVVVLVAVAGCGFLFYVFFF